MRIRKAPFWANELRRRKRPLVVKRNRRLLLEQLEDRSLLALISWDAGGDGVTWTDPLNWSSDALPISNDDVQVDVAGTPTIQIASGTQSINRLISHEHLLLSGGTLSVSLASTVTADLTLSGGTLSGSGDVTITGLTNWISGTMSGSGKTIIASGGTLDFSSAIGRQLNRTLQNDGTTTWNGLGPLQMAGGTFNNNGTFLANIGAGNVVFCYDSSSAFINAFNNAGTFTKQGAGEVRFAINGTDVPFHNSGTVDVQAGTLTLESGGSQSSAFLVQSGATLRLNRTHTFTASANISGAGTLSVVAGTTTFDGPIPNGPDLNISGGTVNLNSPATFASAVLFGGTLSGSGDVTITGLTNWISGTMSGSGKTIIASGAILDFSSAIGRQLNRTLQNDGTTTWNGVGPLQMAGGTFNNNGTFLANIGAGNVVFCYDSSSAYINVFNNAGTFTKQGAGAITFSVKFNNTGIVDVQAGTVSVPATDFPSQAFVTQQVGGILQVNGNITGTTSNSSLWNPAGRIGFSGGGTRLLEVMSNDLGPTFEGFRKNFAYGTLEVTSNTLLLLVNQSDNAAGAGPEALYVNNLIVASGSVLDLQGLNVYARATQINGSIINGTVIFQSDGGPIAFEQPYAGSIALVGEVDDWTFFGRAGRGLTLVVNPGSTATQPSPLPLPLNWIQVEVVDPSGTVVAAANNLATGTGSPVTFLGITLPTDGSYTIRVKAPTAQPSNTGRYAFVAYDSTVDVTPLIPNQLHHGSIETHFSVDHWEFSATENTQVMFDLINASNSSLVFTLADERNTIVFAEINADTGLINLPTSGKYTLSARGLNTVGTYAFKLLQTSHTQLVLGTPYLGTLVSSGQAELFSVNVPQDDKILLVTFSAALSLGQNELYLKYGQPPTRTSYDYRFAEAASSDQRILVPSATTGTWYALVYSNATPSPREFTISATTVPIVLSQVAPARHGTAQDATFSLTGAGFETANAIQLVASTGTIYDAASTQLISPNRILGTYAAGTVPAGLYSVRIVKPNGDSDTITDAVTLVQGGISDLVTNVIVPSHIGFHIASTIYVDYANNGDFAIPAPVLTLTATQNGQRGALMTLDPSLIVSGFWTSATPRGYHQTLQILASGASPGILQPGESARIPVYYAGWLTGQWDFSRPPINFELTVLHSSEATMVDWPSMEEALRPETIAPTAWGALFSNLTANIGGTWGSYVSALNTAAANLGYLGAYVFDVDRLWNHLVQQANGAGAIRRVAGTNDMTVSLSGLSLAVDRAFPVTITGRSQIGPFGAGWVWTNGWGRTLSVEGDGTVAITNPEGDVRLFQPNSRDSSGAYFGITGDMGILRPVSDGAFTLTEYTGETTLFNPNGTVHSLVDNQGHSITATYTDSRLSRLTAESGEHLRVSYNDAGRIITITDFLGQVTTYDYDLTSTFLLHVTRPSGFTRSYVYSQEAFGAVAHALLIDEYTDELQDLFSYNSRGQLVDFRSGYSVTGYVVDQGGVPLANSSVALHGSSDRLTHSTATTGLDGKYVIAGVPKGTYDLAILSNGYQALTRLSITVSGTTLAGPSVLLASNAEVKGVVVDSLGNAIANADVSVLDTDNRLVGTARTADDGAFAISTAVGAGLLLLVKVPGNTEPKLFTIDIPAGTSLNLGQIDPIVPDWVTQLILGHERRSDEVHTIRDLTDPECTDEQIKLRKAIAFQDSDWMSVQSTDKILTETASIGALLLLTDVAKLSADAVILAGEAAILFELWGVAAPVGIAADVYEFVGLMSTLVDVIALARDISLHDSTPLDTISGVLDAANLVREKSVELLVKLTSAKDSAIADGQLRLYGQVFGTVGIVGQCIGVVADIESLCGNASDMLRELEYLAERARGLYQRYNGSVVGAHIALAYYERCLGALDGGDGGDLPDGEDKDREIPPGSVPPGSVPPGSVPPGSVPPGSVPPWLPPPGPFPPGSTLPWSPPLALPPVPPGIPGGKGSVTPVNSMDPNSKVGPAGFGMEHALGTLNQIFYHIEFENDPKASAPAQMVEVSDHLSPQLDWSSFRFDSLGFGDTIVYIPPNSQYFRTAVVMSYNGRMFDVWCELQFDSSAGIVTARFQSIDSVTNLPPDVLTGFLPPEDGTGRGQGFISFTVLPRMGISTGTEIRNVALISFDQQTMIATNQVDPHDASLGTDPSKEALITIDADSPVSRVADLLAVVPAGDRTVSWSGVDDGSGIAVFDIYVSVDGGPYLLWIGDTPSTSGVFSFEADHTYDFFSVATDNVGLVESHPIASDASTFARVPNDPPRIDPIDDHQVLEGHEFVFAIVAHDPDAGQVLRYGLIGNGLSGITIDSETGIVRWTPLDGPFEIDLSVGVIDDGSPALIDEQTFRIVVVNVPPLLTFDEPTVTVDEGSSASNHGGFLDLGYDDVILAASIGLLTDNGDGTWSWSWPASDGPNDTQTVTITATDSDGASNSETFSLVVNNVPPAVHDVTFQLEENSPSGTSVGLLTASDPGRDNYSYAILSGTGATAFNIDANTGEITVADAAQLDYETTKNFTLKVAITDDDGGAAIANVTINLLNLASINGLVFIDANQNELFDANETGIDGIIIELLDEMGSPVLDHSGAPIKSATSQGGLYLFEDLAPRTYRLRELQPSGVSDGPEFVGSLGGTIPANDTMQLTLARTDAFDYVFSEFSVNGQGLTRGDTAGIGFWQNKNGQDLIKQGGSALAAWLTSNFGNIFGNSFVGATGDDVAKFYKDELFKQQAKKSSGPAKVDAQFMAVALAVFFTSRNLAGGVAAGFGFNVTDNGIGVKIVNIGSRGAAFNVANNSDITVMQLLLATNRLTDMPDHRVGFAYIYDRNGDGVIDASEALLRSQANDQYSWINDQGGI